VAAGSFIRVTLRDGSTHTVLIPGDTNAAAVVEAVAKGQPWPQGRGWTEVEGGGAVTRRLVATDQIVSIELFERG
jgi:hypothetical protein